MCVCFGQFHRSLATGRAINSATRNGHCLFEFVVVAFLVLVILVSF